MAGSAAVLTSKRQSIELFSGAGGLALATHLAGFEHSGLFEWNPDACKTLILNAMDSSIPEVSHWWGKVNEGDVTKTSFRDFDGVDLVAGGPPCQPFSLGGKHKGMQDKRDMIPQFIRAVREARPKAFLMENVRGLARKSFAAYLNYSLLQLSYPEIEAKSGEEWSDHLRRLHQHKTSKPIIDGLKYNVVCDVLNAADYGVPQCRERLFVIGFRSDIDAKWCFPVATHSCESLIYEQATSRVYWDRVGVKPKNMPSSFVRRRRAVEMKGVPEKLPWRTIREAIADLPKPFVDCDDKGLVFNHRRQLGARPYQGHTGSPIDAPSKTLKAGDHGVPGGENMIDFGNGDYRYFTIREAARVQTFPDEWRFEGAWTEAMRQLGNAVPVNLARIVAESVRVTLERMEK